MMKQHDPLKTVNFRRIFPSFGGILALVASFALTACDKGGDPPEASDDSGTGAAAASAGSAKPAADEAQTIKLSRPQKPGDKYHIVSDGRSRQVMEMTMNGTPAPGQSKSEDYSGKIDADVEVLEVSELGKASKATIQVKSLTRSDDGGADEVLLTDATLDAAVGADGSGTVFSIAGSPVDSKIAETLSLFSLMSSGDSKDDEDAMFGTDEPRKPGEEWDIDGAALATSFAEESGMGLAADSVSGTMKFEKIEDVDGVPCQIIAGNVNMELSSIPGLPTGAKVTNATVSMIIRGAFPIDTSLPPASMTMSMEMNPDVKFSAQGVVAELTMDIFTTSTSKQSLKK